MFSVLFVPKNPSIKQTNTVTLRALLDCYAKVQKILFSFPFSASICFQSYEQRPSSKENQTNNLQIGSWTETLYQSFVFESSFLQRSSFQNGEITTRFILKWKLSTSQVLIKEKTTCCQENRENFPSFFSLRQHNLQHEEMRTKVEQELTFYTLKVEDLNDTNLKDKPQTCKHFHVGSEYKKAILKVFNFAKETFSP